MRNEQWVIHTRVTGSYEMFIYYLIFLEFDAYVFKAILSIETFFKLIEYISLGMQQCRFE